jgi:hypothetical protein
MTADLRRKLRSRKYDARHRRIRADLAQWVAAGLVKCARCGEPIAAGTPWDLGHDDRNPGLYSGPEHAHCNRGAANRNQTSRVW